jgi:hypothetical protein
MTQQQVKRVTKITRLKLGAIWRSALLGMIGDLIIRSVGTDFLIPGVVASYINILTLTTKTSCAVHPAMRLCCLHVPLLLRERAQARRFRGPLRRLA